MRTLYDGPQWRVSETLAMGIVTIVRTNQPFTSLAELDRETSAIERVLTKARLTSSRVLVDLRHGPLRNDPAFESAIARTRKIIYGTFDRSAVLVSTAVGRLQVMRHARVDGLKDFAAFNSEAEAMAFLHEP